MDDVFRTKLRRIHRGNRILWTSILAGVIILLSVGFALFKFQLITPAFSPDMAAVKNISLFVTLFLILLIFYLKRTYLVPAKMIERAQKKEISIEPGDVADLVQEFGKEANLIAKVLIIMRRYFMVVWSIANLIILVGFIEFVLTGNFQSLLIYGVVSLYSLAINFPAFSIIERCYNLLNPI